jgi:hypothetical protein
MTIDELLAERGTEYGEYGCCAETAQRIKIAMRSGASWASLTDPQRESLEMIATKVARIVNGTPKPDSFHDIAGYAKLAGDRM